MTLFYKDQRRHGHVVRLLVGAHLPAPAGTVMPNVVWLACRRQKRVSGGRKPLLRVTPVQALTTSCTATG
jgi:hypothetical protein